jgi:hypothetical protein
MVKVMSWKSMLWEQETQSKADATTVTLLRFGTADLGAAKNLTILERVFEIDFSTQAGWDAGQQEGLETG